MGVSVLISPSCPYPVTQIPMSSNYALAVKIGSLRIVCLYLLPTMSTHDALAVLSSIPLTNDTIICSNFNSCLGSLTEECALTVVNGQLSPCTSTFISFHQNVEISSIIDLLITNMSLTNATLNIHTNLSLNSDHQHPPPSRLPIDTLTDELNSLIYNYLTSSIGNRPPCPPHWKKFWNSVLQAAAGHRNFCYKKWHRVCGIDRIHWWDKHLKVQAEF
ncbi:hypothetical protein PHYBLDRAFT_153358 [Phycomyces blakesleeanus NRRL 1555(-)]|uniref:Uncharacterized protein n=1 Tax=Phycomyces blakesleeanus (strain ATCC 8743b / DSM 1359 / FGSC 10004 / NBRC 33097 / NRRL 1555) TaxID=763407 RepID=A0A167J892_PHYB8|nr:hypothetical protein PHYBLDRAFT_153358 [Phycomyces blakesleeanus NRRL 1555(-)]OAD65459.1 hypothetical protein PHYBLDRAFT_153358 [Phycomyces blakesleeanus NRRL 1555(-)]|eukprot:XP_018283499.1 hypothetical protein PHYBLDRAFT_153358 [Phycomyces blakesleeanus NRRL 1555(-)]